MQRGVPTERGGEWRAVSVARLLRRIEIIPGIEIGTGFSRVLPPRSVNAVVTSPPYAEQRSRQYGGIPEAAYPAWTVEWMEKLRPALSKAETSRSSSGRTSKTGISAITSGKPAWQFVKRVGSKPTSFYGSNPPPPLGNQSATPQVWEHSCGFQILGAPIAIRRQTETPMAGSD